MKSVRFTKAESSNKCDWFTSCGAIDAMVIFDTPFRGQHELTLLGSEQTTSLLVVMITYYPLGGNGSFPYESFARIRPFSPWMTRSLC